MSEDILHFLWKHKHTNLKGLKTTEGQLVEVVDPGEHNFDSGPDFFNAKVKIGDTLWAGNIEIHFKSSDWNQHNHSSDPFYDTIILHVVAKNDIQIHNTKGQTIPTLVIPYPNEIEWELQRLVGSGKWIPCADIIGQIQDFPFRMWLNSLLVERLEQKVSIISNLSAANNEMWEEVFYQSVARSFGLKINALPFELLSKSVPLRVLGKMKGNLFQIEALLFGQAGMLAKQSDDDYFKRLKKEYQYIQQKHQLQPIPSHLWKFMRLRPMAFPTIRIAQFAMLIHQSTGLFSKTIEAKNLKDYENLFCVGVSEYWQNHYTFEKKSRKNSKKLGSDTLKNIVLNSVIPTLFAYGKARNNEALKDKSLAILEELPPEKNAKVNGFGKLNIMANNSFASQSLIQLKTNYCDRRKCLFCYVGTNILLKKTTP
jgi:hypothetical protein